MYNLFIKQLKDYARTFVRPYNLITSPRIADKPEGERVVVFSPHFDDDVIGCGGTLCKHISSGNEVSVIYFTDGREGDPSFADKELLQEKRKEEARSATQILGIQNLYFLDEPETKLKATEDLIKRLIKIIYEIKPDLLYIPSFLENHIDHFEVNRVLLALAKRSALNFNIAAYEVWTPIIPNMIIDITSVISRKEDALKQYETQIRHVNYVTTTLALNKYRTIYNLKGKGYAEAFFVTSSDNYIDYLKRLKLNKRLFIDLKK